LILRLKNEQNKTILLSSHQLSEIELIANRMVIINQGKSIVEGNVQDLLQAEEIVVKVTVDDSEKAKRCIAQLEFAQNLEVINSIEIEVLMKKNEIAAFNKFLVQHDVAVFSLEPKRKLEDYFIKIIQA
jgi:ABC-type multidrug transport system ATPase subunit